MTKCLIRWVKDGKETPDDNVAVQLVRTVARTEQIGGRGVSFSASDWYPICAEHSKRLTDAGMHIWECKPLEGINKYNVRCGMRSNSGWPPPVTITASTMYRTVTVWARDVHGARAEAIDECYRQWGNSIEHVKPGVVAEVQSWHDTPAT